MKNIENKMYNTIYSLHNGDWNLYINLFAKIKSIPLNNNYYKISENIGIKFADKPLNPTGKFVETDMKYLIKGLQFIKDTLSEYINKHGILIEVHSISLWDVQYFQEEGLSAAVIKLMSEIYKFEMPFIPIYFDKKSNKYIFEMLT